MHGIATVARPFDGIPHLPGAGLADELNDESTDRTLRGDGVDLPTTPDHMKKWRKNYDPGVQTQHPGVADDLDYKRGEIDPIYGRVEPVGVKVHDIMNVAAKSYLLEKANLKSEEIYLSHKREPLGQQYTRGHALPASLVQNGFGRPTPQDISGDLSKQLLMPVERVVPPEEKALYIKSHANFDPGEQKRRGYTWVDKHGEIDPHDFNFGGIVSERDVNGMAKAMNPKLDSRIPKDPVVCGKLLEDYREVHGEQLGIVKNLGFGDRGVDTRTHVFGKPSQAGPEWGTRECMGNYTAEEQQPDKDLGRSLKPGWRNIAKEGTQRVFGVPSIRKDIEAPHLKSVADHQNYGNESGAEVLLYPPRFTDEGIEQADFLYGRNRDEIKDIFECAGFGLSEQDFNFIFEQATHLDPSGQVSVESFRKVLNGPSSSMRTS